MSNNSAVLSPDAIKCDHYAGRPPGNGSLLVATSAAPDNFGALITAEAAAQLCDVSLRTWRRLEAEGMVPKPVRLAGRIKRYRRGELLAWMEAGCPAGEQWENIRQVEQRRRAR